MAAPSGPGKAGAAGARPGERRRLSRRNQLRSTAFADRSPTRQKAARFFAFCIRGVLSFGDVSIDGGHLAHIDDSGDDRSPLYSRRSARLRRMAGYDLASGDRRDWQRRAARHRGGRGNPRRRRLQPQPAAQSRHGDDRRHGPDAASHTSPQAPQDRDRAIAESLRFEATGNQRAATAFGSRRIRAKGLDRQ
jgi:hypothetical protein